MKADFIRIEHDHAGYGSDTASEWISVSELEEFRLERLRDEVRLIDGTLRMVKSAKSVWLKFKKKNGILAPATERLLERDDIKCIYLGKGTGQLPVYVPWADSDIGEPPLNVLQVTKYEDGILTVSINYYNDNRKSAKIKAKKAEKQKELYAIPPQKAPEPDKKDKDKELLGWLGLE